MASRRRQVRTRDVALRTRPLTVLGQDPTLIDRTGVVTVQAEIPVESLAPGPQGARFHVVDADASKGVLYAPVPLADDAFAKVTEPDRLVRSRAFHCQNVYGTAMETLSRFERALGRRVPWAIPGGSLARAATGRGHVLKLAPHAFPEANAYYSRRDEGVLFGYFASERPPHPNIFTCLSHDVIAHEITHAVLDGLHPRYTDPSSDDQAAFHEGFADVVALLAAFRYRRVVDAAFTHKSASVPARELTTRALRGSILAGLADQLGDELTSVRGKALRASAEIAPSPDLYTSSEYREPHRRGELLVAAVMNAFLDVLLRRLAPLRGAGGKGPADRERLIEEAAEAADHLLNMVIRALDYAPPVDIDFRDFLSAILTGDHELNPDDSKYGYREALKQWFENYGIHPWVKAENGMWDPPRHAVTYRRNHFESLMHDADEAFHFVWENRDALELNPEAFTYVPSVKQADRVDEDGFIVREIIVEYVQILHVQARELRGLRLRAPDGMPAGQTVELTGGGVLVFDEFARLKFHIASGVTSSDQSDKLESLWNHGYFHAQRSGLRRVAAMHRARAMGGEPKFQERW